VNVIRGGSTDKAAAAAGAKCTSLATHPLPPQDDGTRRRPPPLRAVSHGPREHIQREQRLTGIAARENLRRNGMRPCLDT